MDRKLIEFEMETRGHCFFCLSKLDPGSSSVTHSLDELSRYLKVDRRKVFSEKAPIPPHLLKKVEQSILKSKLCSGCGTLNKTFSNVLCKPPEVDSSIQNKAIYFMTFLVHEKMTKAEEETGKVSKLLKSIVPKDGAENWIGKLDIVERLRTDVMHKCSQKLRCFFPRVRIAKLSTKEVTREKLKLKLIPYSVPDPNPRHHLQLDYPFLKVIRRARADNIAGPQSSPNPQNFRHRCNLCNKQYQSIHLFQKHFDNAHRNRTYYTCTLCKKEFSSRNGYKLHHRNSHGEVPLTGSLVQKTCPICFTGFHTSCLMEEHFLVVHSEFNERVCNRCHSSKIFDSYLKLHEHVRMTHANDPGVETCSGCGQTFLSETYLLIHQQKVNCGKSWPFRNPTRTYPSHPEDELSPSTSTPIMDMDTVIPAENVKLEGESTIKIDNDPSPPEFFPETSADIEIGEVKVEPVLLNSYSESSTSSYSEDSEDSEEVDTETGSSLNRWNQKNQRKKSKSTKTQRICLLCKKTFLGAFSLRKHLNVEHLPSGDPKCDHCSVNFKSKQDLHQHWKKLHELPRKHSCEFCVKSYKRTDHLLGHQRKVHPDQRKIMRETRKTTRSSKVPPPPSKPQPQPAQKKANEKHSCHCEKCGQGFTKLCSLYRHMRQVHLQVRRYSCDQCGALFKTATHLKNHVKTVHMALLEHECDLCGKKFGRVHHMRTHRRTVHCPKLT